MGSKMADVWVVAGPPGSGKTTVADILVPQLFPPPALLDKDIIYGGFVTAMLAAANRPIGEREGEWYDENIKGYEYSGMTAVAREIRSKGCPVLLSAPFTQQIHSSRIWHRWVHELGGENVRLVWIRSDAVTLCHRLEIRNSERDAAKLKNFDQFILRIQPDKAPAVPHITIDNRLSSKMTLEAQLDSFINSIERRKHHDHPRS